LRLFVNRGVYSKPLVAFKALLAGAYDRFREEAFLCGGTGTSAAGGYLAPPFEHIDIGIQSPVS